MTRMENLLRTAIRQTAAEVTEESIPVLDPDMLPVTRRPPLPSRGVLSPLLAAAAVVLVAALALTLSTTFAARRPPAGSGQLSAAPKYYAALTAAGQGASQIKTVTVRSTSTGEILATLAAPRPYGTFILVQGTAGDRTFLVGAQVWQPSGSGMHLTNIAQPARLYLLHFSPATRRAWLTAPPIPQFSGQYLRAASISPDGSRVAVGYHAPMAGKPGAYETSIRLYTLPSGAERTLSLTPAQNRLGGDIGLQRDNPAAIAWASDDRTISYTWGGSQTENGVHVLDTSIPGPGTLLSASRLIVRPDAGNFQCTSDPFLTANGAYIVCGGFVVPPGMDPVHPRGTLTQGFAKFSATTGKLVSVIVAQRGTLPPTKVSSRPGRQYPPELGALPYLLWANPDGSVLIGTVESNGAVIHDGHPRTIPWSYTITGTEGSQIPAIASW